MIAKPRAIIQITVAAVFWLMSAVAPAGDDFPGRERDSRTLKTQEQVDSLFEKGDYERAYFVYREELAPHGDKFAQYMVGYMQLTGKGVPSNVIEGSAWYRLAAERGDKMFSKVRDEILAQFNESQLSQSDQVYQGLRNSYSDAMIITNFIEKDIETLESRVDISAMVRDLTDAGYYDKDELAKRYEEAIRRIEIRLTFIEKEYAAEGRLGSVENRKIEQVERRAKNAIQAYRAGD